MGLLNKAMLQTNEIYGSVILDKDDPSVTKEGASAYSKGNEDGTRKSAVASNFGNGLFSGGWKVPNMLYCPENIFSNKIPALDVNFIHPNTYTGVYGNETESYASRLATTISSWYKAFRNISVVGLLCVLIYLGIRILIETTAEGKAKYKEALVNWVMALCLVFAIHFIMAGTLMLIDKVTELLTNSLGDSTIYVDVVDGNSKTSFKTNLTGYMRFMAESNNWGDATAYSIIYVVLVIYTIMFTFTYLKRFLWMAFLTMIAPLVSLTYPIDKAGDGKAQAFNMWFKEYIMNAILQPVHLLLYSVMVASAMDLASENPIYALVAIGFLIPAEKFIKKMFGLDKGQTAGGLGSFAGGAMTMKALESLGKKAPPPLKNAGGKESNNQESNNGRIFQKKRSTLESFKENDSLDIDSQDTTRPELSSGGTTSDEINKNDGVDVQKNNVDDSEKLLENIDKDNINNTNELNNENEIGNKFEKPSMNSGSNSKPLRLQTQGPKNSMKRALLNTAIRGARTIPKNGKLIAKKGIRAGMKGAGALIGSTIGIAAGIASGDPSKVFQYGITGAAAGNKIGEGTFNAAYNTANVVSDFAKDKAGAIKNAYMEERYSLAQAQAEKRFEQNEKAKKEFMKNDEEKRKYKEIVAKIQENGGDCTLEQAMNAAFDYKVAGISDDKIATGLELESQHGGIGGNQHEQMMDIMNLTNKYSSEYITDDKKRGALEGIVASNIKNTSQQNAIMQLFAEAHGQGAYYRSVKNNNEIEIKANNVKVNRNKK